MAVIAQTKACLRIFGDDLNPDEVSEMLAASPTQSARKGAVRGGQSQRQYIEKSGSWRFKVPDKQPGNLDAQIQQIFASLTSDISVWSDLSSRFRIDIFCGLFMDAGNEGLEICPGTLQAMGQRGVTMSLDVYDPTPD